jgi:hypothetical protein
VEVKQTIHFFFKEEEEKEEEEEEEETRLNYIVAFGVVCCKTKTSQLPVCRVATGDTREGRSILQTSREQKCICSFLWNVARM